MSITVEDIRSSNKKMEDSTEVLSVDLQQRINEADDTVEVDVSGILTPTQITSIGDGSKVLNLLTLYKALELSFVLYYGAKRKVEDTNDIAYYSKLYKDLLDKIIDGKVKIVDGTTDYTTKSYPKKTSSTYNEKFYPQKGVENFVPPGQTTDLSNDRFKK